MSLKLNRVTTLLKRKNMKRKLLIAMMVLGATLASCKKVYQTYEAKPEYPTAPITQASGDNYKHSESYIITNDWKIVGRDDADNGNIRTWKLQVVGTLNFLIIDPVDATKYWATGYQLGDVLKGNFVINLKIKTIK